MLSYSCYWNWSSPWQEPYQPKARRGSCTMDPKWPSGVLVSTSSVGRRTATFTKSIWPPTATWVLLAALKKKKKFNDWKCHRHRPHLHNSFRGTSQPSKATWLFLATKSDRLTFRNITTQWSTRQECKDTRDLQQSFVAVERFPIVICFQK